MLFFKVTLAIRVFLNIYDLNYRTMSQNQEIILKLIEKLEQLYKKQSDFNAEINSLKEELYRLKSTPESAIPVKTTISEVTKPIKVQDKIVKEYKDLIDSSDRDVIKKII